MRVANSKEVSHEDVFCGSKQVVVTGDGVLVLVK